MCNELLIKNGRVIDPANGSAVPGQRGRSKESVKLKVINAKENINIDSFIFLS
jgi:hypothetical protein